MILASIKIFPIKDFLNNRKRKQENIIEYNSLLSIMSTTGYVIYHGVIFRSIADFTIAFFDDHK